MGPQLVCKVARQVAFSASATLGGFLNCSGSFGNGGGGSQFSGGRLVGELSVADGVVGAGEVSTGFDGVVGVGWAAVEPDPSPTRTPIATKPRITASTTPATMSTMPVLLRGCPDGPPDGGADLVDMRTP